MLSASNFTLLRGNLFVVPGALAGVCIICAHLLLIPRDTGMSGPGVEIATEPFVVLLPNGGRDRREA